MLTLHLLLISPIISVADSSEVTLNDANVFNIKITGELKDETKKALEQLLKQPTLYDLLLKNANRAQTYDEICSNRRCEPEVLQRFYPKDDNNYQTFKDKSINHPLQHLVIEPNTQIKYYWQETRRNEPNEFILVNANDPIIREMGLDKSDQVLAVPIDKNQLAESNGIIQTIPVKNTGAQQTLQLGNQAKIDLIEHDLEISGESQRQLLVNRQLSLQERENLISQVVADPAIAAIDPQVDFQLDVKLDVPEIPGVSAGFELVGTDCPASTPNWPYDVNAVSDALSFNRKVLENMDSWPPKRSKILIVDSGIHSDLINNTKFRPLLYINTTERLTANTALARDVLQHKNTDCLDFDGNDHPADLYGASPWTKEICREKDFAETRLNPIERNINSNQSYFPEHGSFVAGLAAGGPKLIELSDDLSKYLGITFYRITTPSSTSISMPMQSVDIDSVDIKNALNYAKAIDADIVNLSFKTSNETIFSKDIIENHPSLFVTSAGNFAEALEGRAPENLPASFPTGNDSGHIIRRQLIVVAALKNDVSDPFWEHSAFSDTKVDVAAPGVDIISFDHHGNEICGYGTSAAAPLVSFTAALLKSLGLSHNLQIRERIYLTSDTDDKLIRTISGTPVDLVKGKRKINIPAAVDLFVDQISIKGETSYRRGWIIGDTSENNLLTICDGNLPVTFNLSASRGKIDLSHLASWVRASDSEGTVSHWLETPRTPKFVEPEKCKTPSGSYSFINLEDGQTHSINWSDTIKIVPTPFRNIKEAIFTVAGF